jgi:hypothetical protein
MRLDQARARKGPFRVVGRRLRRDRALDGGNAPSFEADIHARPLGQARIADHEIHV